MEGKQKKIDKNKHYKVNNNTYGIKLDKRHILLIFCYQSQEEIGSELIPFSLFIPLVCNWVESNPMQIWASGVKESLSEYPSVNRSYSSSESAHPRLSNGRVLKFVIVIKLLCAHFVPRLVLGAAGIRAIGTEEWANPLFERKKIRNYRGSETYPGIRVSAHLGSWGEREFSRLVRLLLPLSPPTS